jgi:ferredoxin-NADP reductase
MATLKLLSSYPEVGNIRTFVFEAGGLTWLAGQYQTYILNAVEGKEAEKKRFFTIAAAPSEGEIHISTRVTESKFKQALNAMQPGDTIEAHNIEGDFTWEETGEPVVLVAAGIGVTPFRSILLERHALGKPLNATLVHFNREDAVPFRTEFEKLAAEHPELTLNYIVGQPVTAEAILEIAPSASSQVTYLSGPEPMVDAVGDELKKHGINLKQDWFPGYDETSF